MTVIATAGHVDHGKSSLVRALTGREPDRLAEEKRRGLTLDLGFAWTTLASDEVVAFVDVPGHPRFLTTALAGLNPACPVLFAVAADKGWQEQSEEHLEAMLALGISRVVFAITRIDLADPGPAMEQVREAVEGTPLSQATRCAVSARTGAGLDSLRQALHRLLGRLPEPDPEGPVRVWVDRSFSMPGAGTVATGTLTEGRVRTGDVLLLGSKPTTVRSIQTREISVAEIAPVSRVALSLRGVHVSEAGRGTALLAPGRWSTSSVIDVAIEPGTRSARAMLHLGTAAVQVRIRPLGHSHARLSLDRALPVRVGDRCLLREPGTRTIHSIVVADLEPPSFDRSYRARHRATALEEDDVLRDRLVRTGPWPVRDAELAGFLTAPEVTPPGVAVRSGWLYALDSLAGWSTRAGEIVGEHEQAQPLARGLSLQALAARLEVPVPVAEVVVAEAGLTSRDGGLSTSSTSSMGAIEPAVARLEHRLRAAPFDAPSASELRVEQLGPRELAAAERHGRVLRLAPDVVLLPDAPERALVALRELPQPFSTSRARQALATSRRVAVPLLEHLDRTHRTVPVEGHLRRVVGTTAED